MKILGNSNEIVVIGAGSQGKVTIDVLRTQGTKVLAIYDDTNSKWGTILAGVPVCGPVAALLDYDEFHGIVAIGDNRGREDVVNRLPHGRWARAIHSGSIIADLEIIGEGTTVCAGVIVQPDAVIGRHCLLNTGAAIDHDCQLGDFIHLAPGSRLGAKVKIGNGTLVAMSACIVSNITVGSGAVVGAGVVVLRDVAGGELVYGVPAKVARQLAPR